MYIWFLLHWCKCCHFFSVEALSKLDVVIRQPNAQQSENAMAYDNAVSALGKICQFHRDCIDAGRVKISRLPLSTYFFTGYIMFLLSIKSCPLMMGVCLFFA